MVAEPFSTQKKIETFLFTLCECYQYSCNPFFLASIVEEKLAVDTSAAHSFQIEAILYKKKEDAALMFQVLIMKLN